MSGSKSLRRLAAFNTSPTDCRNGDRMATFCSEFLVMGFSFPGVHRLCLVSWECAITPGLPRLKNGCSPIWYGDPWPWAVHIFKVTALCSKLSPP